MNIETLNKANKIKEKINLMNSHINALSYTIEVKDRCDKDRKDKKSVGILRFNNRFNISKKNEQQKDKKAQVILFDNLEISGYYDIEVDEEFINYLTEYYKLKKKELEKQLEEL